MIVHNVSVVHHRLSESRRSGTASTPARPLQLRLLLAGSRLSLLTGEKTAFCPTQQEKASRSIPAASPQPFPGICTFPFHLSPLRRSRRGLTPQCPAHRTYSSDSLGCSGHPSTHFSHPPPPETALAPPKIGLPYSPKPSRASPRLIYPPYRRCLPLSIYDSCSDSCSSKPHLHPIRRKTPSAPQGSSDSRRFTFPIRILCLDHLTFDLGYSEPASSAASRQPTTRQLPSSSTLTSATESSTLRYLHLFTSIPHPKHKPFTIMSPVSSRSASPVAEQKPEQTDEVSKSRSSSPALEEQKDDTMQIFVSSLKNESEYHWILSEDQETWGLSPELLSYCFSDE
jgi:hypothetical protein